jgi:hypothetical protein
MHAPARHSCPAAHGGLQAETHSPWGVQIWSAPHAGLQADTHWAEGVHTSLAAQSGLQAETQVPAWHTKPG